MTLPRAVGLILVLAAVAGSAVYLRVQRARVAHEIHKMARQEIDLVRQIDQTNAKIAELRAPQHIRDRAARMQLSALPPEVREVPQTKEAVTSRNGLASKRKR
jgi:cell division protein FtsL